MARVLIVDDEPDILLMLRVTLEAEGHETALAADGETALQRVSADRFDVMLLDVMMPVMDGWGVLDNLARHDNAPRVIVVSAKSAERDVARALEAGAVEFLSKPFSPKHLCQLVATVVSLDEDQIDEYRKERLSPRGG